MDLKARIRRRQRGGADARLILDHDAISPIAHVEEPVGRGSILERLLDYLDPVFEGDLPPDAYIWGPAGSGKSAIVTALFTQLQTQLSRSRSIIHTTTRTASTVDTLPTFIYIDTRTARSDFALYRTILDAILDDPVPEKGVGTETLQSQLEQALRPFDKRLVVAFDHVGEPETSTVATIAELLAPFDASVTWIAVSRADPADLDIDRPPVTIELPAYRDHALVDILTSRASEGIAQRALDHEQTREIATWAEGNAHDALTALFGAADHASNNGRSHIQAEDITTAMMDIPRSSTSLSRVFSLPQNRQRVLRALVDLTREDRNSVDRATDTIVSSPSVDLSAGTVKRFLYELAETGIIQRVRETENDGHGRPPSRVEPDFSTQVFRRLYDLRDNEG